MSAMTPGIRRIWMDAVVHCVDQRMARICQDNGLTAASLKSDPSAQKPTSLTDGALQTDHTRRPVSLGDATANNGSQTASDKAEAELTSALQWLSSETYPLPPSCSDTMLHTDAHSAEVRAVFT